MWRRGGTAGHCLNSLVLFSGRVLSSTIKVPSPLCLLSVDLSAVKPRKLLKKIHAVLNSTQRHGKNVPHVTSKWHSLLDFLLQSLLTWL